MLKREGKRKLSLPRALKAITDLGENNQTHQHNDTGMFARIHAVVDADSQTCPRHAPVSRLFAWDGGEVWGKQGLPLQYCPFMPYLGKPAGVHTQVTIIGS